MKKLSRLFLLVSVFLFVETRLHAQAPTISSFTPSSGNPGKLVTITGTNLGSPTAFTIGGATAIVVSKTGTSLVGMVMPGSSTGTISISNASGTVTSSGTFTVTATPYPSTQQGNKLVGTGAVGNAYQGLSVSISADGNTAIVGGYNDNSAVGAAWVYTRSGGTWSQQGSKLVGTGITGTGSAQGYSVSLSADGNTAIVGGTSDNSSVGAAWVFTRSGGTWTQQGSKLVGTGAVGLSYQGSFVSLSADGNTAMVGGPGDNNFAGASWVYTRSGSTWTQQGGKLVGTGASGTTSRQGSVSLSADGNTAMVGGNGDNTFTGAAWVFKRSGSTWTQQGSKLVGTGATGIARQGMSVSLSANGNTAMVGGTDDNSGAGAAWVFTRSGSTWTQQGSKLVGTGAVGAAYQGGAVSLTADGNTAMVGGYNDNGMVGAAWVYTRTGSTWTQQGSKLVGTDIVGTAGNGMSVSLSADGNTAMLGGMYDNSSKGAAWVYIFANIVTYNGNGNTGGSVPVATSGVNGTSVTLASNSGSLVKAGYTFAGWNTLADGSGTNYAAGASYTLSVDLTLYAKWTANSLTVTYDSQSGSAISNGTTTTGASISASPGTPTRTGYTFNGWFVAPSGGSAITFPYTHGQTANFTLYAQWTGNTLTVNYDSQSGSAISNGSTPAGGTISISPGTPTRTGYTFNGWFAASTGGSPISFPYTHGQTANFTLYAQWTAYTLTVTYDSQSGSAISNGTTTTGASISASPGTPTRAGFTFNGWFAASTGGDALTFPYTHGQIADFTLYAQWTANTLTVTYDSQSGTAISSGTTTTGASIASSSGTPTRAGHTFNGWFVASTGGSAISFPYSHVQTANFTLYAQWTINNYTVTFNGNGADFGSMSAQTITYNVTANLTANGFTRTDYLFSGWNTQADGSGISYANSASYTMDASDFTLYAEWVKCTWTGASNGNWNDPSNWNANEVPGASIDVVIPAGTINAISTGGTFSSKSVTIQAGATVGISSGGVWNIVGNLQGAAGSVITGVGKVVLNGSSAQTISGTVSVSNLEIGNNAVQITSGSSLNVLPTASNPNALLTLLSGSTLTNSGNLILRSNSFGTGSIGPIPANATLSGNFTQERLLPNTNGWYFVGAPVQSSAFSQWSELNTRISPKQNASMFEYSESDSTTGTYLGVVTEVNGWKVPNTLATAINPSNQPKGYRIYMGPTNPTRLASVTGLPFVQNVIKALTFSPLTGYGGGGWNLIANPYPCAINWNQTRFDAVNNGQSLGNAYYLWNGSAGNYGAYTSLNASSGVGVGGLQENISSSQAFFVKATGTSSLTFKESFKNTNAGSLNYLRTAINGLELLKFKVQQGSNWDEAGVLFYPGSEDGVDPYDALNLTGSAVDVAAIMDNGTNAAINVLPEIGNQRIIPLKVQTPSSGMVSFHFDGIQNFPASVNLYLKDDNLGLLTNLRQNPEVEFEAVLGQSYNRFSLIIASEVLTLNVGAIQKKALRIFPNPVQTSATVLSPVAGELELYNAMGQKVKTQSILIGQSRLDVSGLPKGMYWIKMSGMTEEKLIVE